MAAVRKPSGDLLGGGLRTITGTYANKRIGDYRFPSGPAAKRRDEAIIGNGALRPFVFLNIRIRRGASNKLLPTAVFKSVPLFSWGSSRDM